MYNPLSTPENRRAVKDLRRTLQQPTRGYDAWMRMLLGSRAYQTMRELQGNRPGSFVADRVHKLNIPRQ